jgi:hypothetical protein
MAAQAARLLPREEIVSKLARWLLLSSLAAGVCAAPLLAQGPDVQRKAEPAPSSRFNPKEFKLDDKAPWKAGEVSRLSADDLIALFLKLNVNDPAASPDTNKLHELAKEIRKRGLEDALRRAEQSGGRLVPAKK